MTRQQIVCSDCDRRTSKVADRSVVELLFASSFCFFNCFFCFPVYYTILLDDIYYDSRRTQCVYSSFSLGDFD